MFLRVDISPKRTCKWPQVYEKILNITSHQENANSNHSEVSLHTVKFAIVKKKKKGRKKKKIMTVAEDVKKLEPFYTLSEIIR